MKSRLVVCILVSLITLPVFADIVNIDTYYFDLDQFDGAAVTYRPDGDVDFDGKLWDNFVGVNDVTLGELASGQFGSDPGDQVTLQETPVPDWLELGYGAGALTVGPGQNTFVVYEITSSNSGVDVEGTSFRISFNGNAFVDASLGTATFLSYTPDAENVNQIAFDVTAHGLTDGDTLTTVRIENLDSGSGTSDPDFIFGALAGPPPEVPGPTGWALIAFGALLFAVMAGVIALRRRSLAATT